MAEIGALFLPLVFIVIFGYIFWRLIKYIVESFKPKD